MQHANMSAETWLILFSETQYGSCELLSSFQQAVDIMGLIMCWPSTFQFSGTNTCVT